MPDCSNSSNSVQQEASEEINIAPDSANPPNINSSSAMSNMVSTMTSSSNPIPPGLQSSESIKGRTSLYGTALLEWCFRESQSNVQGRSGSNACAFIALLMGKVWTEGRLLWPRGGYLHESWRRLFIEAMIKGNQIHDDLFANEAVDLDVEEAVSFADIECGIQRVGQQIDIFGRNPIQQLSNVFIQEAQNNMPKSCSVIMTHGRAMLLLVNSDSSGMIVDSHSHGNEGAIVAYSNPGNAHLLAQWLDSMMVDNWNQPLTIASITKVFYN